MNDTGDPVSGQSFAYGYDNIGNRTASLRENEEMDYTANNLNQYTQRTIPDGIDILGSAETNATVTVNSEPVNRHNKYWHKALTVANGSSAAYQDISVVGVYNPPGTNDPDIVSMATGHVFVARTPETFTYDADGNLLSDGRFNYTWDCENRLIGAETLANLPSSIPRKKLEFTYDYMSRRVSKKVYSLATNNWSLITDYFFTYDSWNLVREVVQRPPSAPSTHAIAGKININPNNSPQNEFALTLPNGSTITRDDLIQSYGGYSGPAASIHVKPKGSGKQGGLLVDGTPYELSNDKAYDIASENMTVNLYNDLIKKGKAMGRWWISIEATGATILPVEVAQSSSLQVTNSYVWGLDLSGSLQGAGGIGGLLSAQLGTNSVVYSYDGNGNVSELVEIQSGGITAHYEYDPFGNSLVATGPFAKENTIRFSTKYWDDETKLGYWGYRYLRPDFGRWLSRDPIGEKKDRVEVNLYFYLGNNPFRPPQISQAQRTDKKEYQRPSEVVNTPVSPTYNTIVCSGGRLVIQIGNPLDDDGCTVDHELQHIEDWKKRYGEDLCVGVPAGQLPVGCNDYEKFFNESECKAYKAGKACREKFLASCISDEHRKKLEAGRARDNVELDKLGCK